MQNKQVYLGMQRRELADKLSQVSLETNDRVRLSQMQRQEAVMHFMSEATSGVNRAVTESDDEVQRVNPGG